MKKFVSGLPLLSNILSHYTLPGENMALNITVKLFIKMTIPPIFVA